MYTVYVGKHYCYKANVMYFFTISIFNQNETRHRTKDKSTKSKTKKWKRKCYNFFNAANIYKALKLILIQYC